MDKETWQLSRWGITGLTMVNSLFSNLYCEVSLPCWHNSHFFNDAEFFPDPYLVQEVKSRPSVCLLEVIFNHLATAFPNMFFSSLYVQSAVSLLHNSVFPDKACMSFPEKHRPFDTRFSSNCHSTLFVNFPVIVLVPGVPLYCVGLPALLAHSFFSCWVFHSPFLLLILVLDCIWLSS